MLPYWHDAIAPSLKSGKTVLVAAHGNSLRALYKHLNNVSKEEILELNIPTGIPLLFELDDELKVISHRYLATRKRPGAPPRQWPTRARRSKRPRPALMHDPTPGCGRVSCLRRIDRRRTRRSGGLARKHREQCG